MSLRSSRNVQRSSAADHPIDEQSFLFQLYNKLFTEPVDCAHTCGHRFERKKQDFFAVPVSWVQQIVVPQKA